MATREYTQNVSNSVQRKTDLTFSHEQNVEMRRLPVSLYFIAMVKALLSPYKIPWLNAIISRMKKF